MMLNENQKAIDFTVDDVNRRETQLSTYHGQKILLSFFRNVNCPFCNLRVNELSQHREVLEKNGLKMIFFFESSIDQLQKSTFHQFIQPILMVGDPEKQVYKKYEVEASTSKMMSTLFTNGVMLAIRQGKRFEVPEEKEKHITHNLVPADFLIDENFIIKKAHYGAHLRDYIPIEDIKVFAGI